MNKINVFLVSLLLAVLLQEARAGVESRRMEAEGEADGVWEGKRRKIKIAREEREIEEPRKPRMKGESGENLGDEGGNKRIGREANGDGISENKGYESNKERIKRKKYERIRDKQRDKRDKEKDRNIEKKAVDRKRRDKMKKRRAQTKENNVKKNTDEDKRKDDERREQNKKDKKEETEKENKRNRNSKEKENKRNRNSKEKERNRKKNRTGKESRVNKDDKERERNRKEHKEKPEKETKENRNDKGRKRHKNEEKERDEKETSEERDDEGRERSRNKENRGDKREVKGKKHGRKLKKDNGDVSKAARKANKRHGKNENKNKNKNKVDDVALRFSSSNFRMAHCMVTYKMKENDAFLMTTDGSKQSRKCDTRFVAPKDYRLNFTCPVFNLAPTGCRREKLIVKDTNVKMTFCTNDDVDLASTGNSLNVKHKRKKTKSKECAGTYMCEVTVVRQDLASSLGEGSGGQSASVATDPTNSASSKETSTSTTRSTTVFVPFHSTVATVSDLSHSITSSSLLLISGSPTTSPPESSALQATFEMSDPVPTSSSSSSSASQSSRTTLSSTPAFFTAAQTTESLPEAVFPEFTQISTAPLAPSPPTVAPVTLPPPLPVPTESLPQEVFPEFTQIPTAPLAPSPPTVAPVTLPPPLPVPAPPAPPPPPPLPPAPAPAPPLPPSILPAPQPTLTDALPPTATTTPAATTAAASQDRLFCSNCGLSKITFPRIVGGQAAIRGEFPWQVGIKMDWGGRCGGSLIKHRWVITAGHCYMRGFTASTVYLGDHDRSVNEEGSYEIKAESVMVHPGFDSLTLDNDIALLKLSSPATFSSTVAPVCLARPSEVPVSGKGITTGWGTTTWQGTTATVLQKVAVDYISNAWCNQLYSDRYDITDNMVCTYTLGKDACQGDSGGPLISLAADGRWVLTGVVSFGDQCAKENSPGVFTRASKYILWIEENTPDDDC